MIERRRKEDKVIRFIYAISCLMLSIVIAFLSCYDDNFYDLMVKENTVIRLKQMNILNYIDISSKETIVYSIIQNHVKTILSEYLEPIGNSGKYILNIDKAEEVFDRIDRIYINAFDNDKDTSNLIIEYLNEFK